MDDGYADLVSFGKLAISNPDLPKELLMDIILISNMISILFIMELKKGILITPFMNNSSKNEIIIIKIFKKYLNLFIFNRIYI